MNKSTIAVISFLAGTAAGAFGSYILTKNAVQKQADIEMDELSARYREKMKQLSGEDSEESETEEPEEEEDDAHPFEDPEQDKIDNNEGVKLYHRPVQKDSLSNTYQKAVEDIKEERNMTETERVAELNPTTDPIPGIVEISSDEFMIDQGYTKKTLNYFCGDDMLRLEEENGTIGGDAYIYFRQEYHADNYEDVLGKFLRWAPDYIPESEHIGHLYVRNENLKIDFEVTIFEGSYMALIVEDDEDGEE